MGTLASFLTKELNKLVSESKRKNPEVKEVLTINLYF